MLTLSHQEGVIAADPLTSTGEVEFVEGDMRLVPGPKGSRGTSHGREKPLEPCSATCPVLSELRFQVDLRHATHVYMASTSWLLVALRLEECCEVVVMTV